MKLLIAVLFLTIGCVTPDQRLAATMAGKIGCPDYDISILNKNSGFQISPSTWQASCRGENFICSVAPGSPDLNEMSCAPEVAPGTRVTPAYDPTMDPSDDPLGG